VVDITTPEIRSRMMAGIRGKDTVPELTVRKALHWRGLRYRLHVRDLPGTPDIVLPRYKTVIFVHGCFWHYHDCHLFKMPATRTDFWEQKLKKNRERDSLHQAALLREGWRIALVWECTLRKAVKAGSSVALDSLVDWIKKSNDSIIEI